MDYLIDWYRTALGALYIDNCSVNGMTRDELYTRLYDTELKYPIRGELVSFRPSDRFTNDREWVDACNGNLPSSSPAYDDFSDFNIGECLKESGFIEDTGSGYKVGSAPTLTNSTNGEYPLDGVEVKTNFGDFDNGLSGYYLAQSVFNELRTNVINNSDNYFIINLPSNGFAPLRGNIIIGYSDLPYVYLVKYSDSGFLRTSLGYFYDGNWRTSAIPANYSFAVYPSQSQYEKLDATYWTSTPIPFYGAPKPTFSDSNITVTVSTALANKLQFNTTDFKIYSTAPIVIASSDANAKNYYYWKNGTPSGGFYSTSNNNNVYSYDVVNNNNWNNAYNNYITDVSNYYSTTQNISNEQLTQYIDQSTTINNITNNYITNVVNPDNPDNPDNPSGGGVITNSWLERIYEKLEYIIDILLGRHDPESDTTIYTDNSIKNDVIYYPFSDLFPDVPESDFLPELTTLDIPLISSKMNNVLSRAMPFCYMWQLGTVAEALSAPPRAPTYDIPFKIDRLNIDEEVSIDLSSNSWSVLHSIWITLFMITFLVALFYMTYRFIMLINALF